MVLFHGGFWRRRGGDLHLMTPLAERLVRSGYAVWNVEYGRSGEKFGGWPHTFDHVSSSVSSLEDLAIDFHLDVSRIVLVGHSAGGHLALWAAGQQRVDGIGVSGVIALAPIIDLERASADGLGNNAVEDLLGGRYEDVPDRFSAAAIGDVGNTPVLVVTSPADDSVPAIYSRGVEGSSVSERSFADVDHLDMVREDNDIADEVALAIEKFLANSE